MSAIAIEGLLAGEALAELRAIVARGKFVPGRTTAVGGAASVKHNLQLDPAGAVSAKAVQVLLAALQASPVFQTATWMEAMMTPLFCRYEPGMTYGNHVDGAIMGEPPNTIRCDVAVTVCLNDGADYEGGELVIDAAGLAQPWKGKAGDVIVYAADTLHRVDKVVRGVREVAVLWIQSAVRDPARRRILYDLARSLAELDQSPQPSPAVESLRRSYMNLVRMWV